MSKCLVSLFVTSLLEVLWIPSSIERDGQSAIILRCLRMLLFHSTALSLFLCSRLLCMYAAAAKMSSNAAWGWISLLLPWKGRIGREGLK